MNSIRTTLIASLALVGGCKATNSDEVKLSRGQNQAPQTRVVQKKPKTDAGPVIPLAWEQLEGKTAPKLAVTSPAFAYMAPIPATYSDYGEKSSPPLKINGVPATAKSIVIIVDDPDAKDPKPFVHWVLYNMPATITDVRTAVPGTGQVRQLENTKQGVNSAGSIGYTGPKPPPNDPPHHYYFQVFALDTMLPLEQAAKKDEVIAAAKGHVVAAGELVGTFETKPQP